MLMAAISAIVISIFLITYRVGSSAWDLMDLKVSMYRKVAFRVYLLVERLFKPNKEAVNVVMFFLLNVYDQLNARFVDLELINTFLSKFANNVIIEACIDSKRDRYFYIKRKYNDKSKHMIIKMSDIKAFDYDGKVRDRLSKQSGELNVSAEKAGIRRIK